MNDQYLDIGIQYYIAGRSAVFARLLPVAGNHFHHAIEMILKSFLVSSYPPPELKAQFGHNLKKLWDAFNSVANDKALAKFDSLVSELNTIEHLRYPEKGYTFAVSLSKGPTPKASGEATKNVGQYSVNLEEIDEFIAELLKGRVNPGWIRSLLRGDEAVALYRRENEHALF